MLRLIFTAAGRSRASRIALTILATFALVTCTSDSVAPFHGPLLAEGTWGGSLSGVIVSDAGTHVHIGCTYGDVIGRIPLDIEGEFDVPGSYLLRAFPIAIGPSMPAQFKGQVVGSRLTFIVAVNDTVEHKIQILGPVTVIYGAPAQMGPCPICAVPGRGLR